MRMTSLITLLAVCAAVVPAAAAEEGKKASAMAKNTPPPMLVAVDEITSGEAEPMQELVGTVFYARVSNVAAEVEGAVAAVSVDDGDRVKAGAPLVSLQTDLIDKSIEKTRNAYEQAVIDMEQSRRDLQRIASLHAENLVAESVYDSQFAKTRGLEKKAAGLQADLDRLQLEKQKMVIRAPFAGVVLKREVEKGEWVGEGRTVAVVADDRLVDIVVEVPEEYLAHIDVGRAITVFSRGRKMSGTFVALIPRGDIATRTFAIKIRLANDAGLIEGMAARALLPVDEKISGLLVPRDAVIEKFGRNVIFTVVDGLARMVPIDVTSYSGMKVGVSGAGLEAGQWVVTKGNERIRDGQPVRLME